MIAPAFWAALFAWYAQAGRAALPWRATRDPYRVLVSETMLQQTQVERVVPLYERFVARWPSFAALAAASRADVVRAWKGLGYNSRAIRLHACAVAVVERYAGKLPADRTALLALPGIGPYTADALLAFAFDRPAVALDTNLRRVLHRAGFGVEFPRRAGDADLIVAATASLPAGRAHDANSALMDLGASICLARAPKCLVCPVRDACRAAPLDGATLATLAREHAPARPPQSALPFVRTTRYLRGRIVDRLRAAEEAISLADLERDLAAIVPAERLPEIASVVAVLARDGIVRTVGTLIELA